MLMVLKKQLKKNRKKGFTLVEVIVVLVILAILAAIAIPALTGYIDKANQRALISEGRNIQVALQEIVTEQYGDGTTVNWSAETGATAIGATTIGAEISKLVGQTYVNADITDITTTGHAIDTFSYEKGGKKVSYDAGGSPKYTVS